MNKLLNIMKIITKFVNYITVVLQLVSCITFLEPSVYNQRKMINIVTVYKGSYANFQPPYTTSQGVNIGQYQTQILSFVRSPA